MGSLTKGEKIGIGLAIFLTVGLALGLGLYFALRPEDNEGSLKFGTLVVRNKTTNQQELKFTSGDQVELQYGGVNPHKTPVDFEIRTSKNGSFAKIATDTYGNTFTYTLPVDLFSTDVTFRVVDTAVPSDFVDSAVVSVTPVFEVLEGAGLVPGQAVYRIFGASVTLELDEKIPALSTESDFAIDVSATKDFAQTEAAELESYSVDTKVLKWRTGTTLDTVYYRVRTTSLISKGEPEELVFALPNPIAVKSPPECSDTDPRICSIRMTTTSGTEGKFTSGESVVVLVTFFGTLPTGLTFTETSDGTTFTPVALGTPTVDGEKLTASYSHTLGNFSTTDYEIRVVDGVANTTSTKYSVLPTFTTKGPSLYNVIPKEAPSVVAVKTVVQGHPNFTGYLGTWSVGYVNPTTSDVVIVKDVMSRDVNVTSATVTWDLNSEDLASVLNGSTVMIDLQLVFQLSGTAGSLRATSATDTNFRLAPFNPRQAPLFQAGTDMKTSVQGELGSSLRLSTGTTKDTYWFDGDGTQGNICLFTGTEQPPYSFQCWKVQQEPSGLNTVTVAEDSFDEFTLGGPLSQFTVEQGGVAICVDPSVGVLTLSSMFSGCDTGFELFNGQWPI